MVFKNDTAPGETLLTFAFITGFHFTTLIIRTLHYPWKMPFHFFREGFYKAFWHSFLEFTHPSVQA
jgi:hypothetical protein